VLEDALRDLERRLGVRPGDGLQVAGTTALARRPVDPGWPLLILGPSVPAPADAPASAPADAPAPARAPAASSPARAPAASSPSTAAFDPIVLPGRQAHGADPATILRALYPPDHPVVGLAGGRDTTVAEFGALAASTPGAWYVPPLIGQANLASPHSLPWLVARLRAPDGCPWDREQTHQSLRRHLLEEAYEVYDALEAGSTAALADELGDLLLQVVLHAEYAAEAGVFDLTDVYRSIMAKIVRRHPHVFGDVEARTVGEVLRNWETIKAGERADRAATDEGTVGASGAGAGAGMPEAFAGLSRSLPALAYAQEMQDRAASLGYDWPDVEGVLDKLEEEALELLGAESPEARREEFGDLLLVIVNLGRKLGIDAEAALRAASAKFAGRFARVERLAGARRLAEMTFEDLDLLWQAAKREEETAR
jgi:tetrapyrrole methylase family protein/MazG family protein